MIDAHLDWPFLDATHRALATAARAWARESGAHGTDRTEGADAADVDAICRRHVASLGAAGLLR
jgi:hypothetical protein